MKKLTRFLFYGLLLLIVSPVSAQFKDSFDDGNYTSNPAWTGNQSDWMINSALQLQSNNQVANSTFYISTANALATVAQWEFSVTLTFNTSGTNYVDAFLTASQSDLAGNATTGYFVRIGNTDDEICLYRKDATGQPVKIIDGINGVTNSSNNTLKIKVVRATGNVFTLYRDATGTGNNYINEGSTTDATFTTSAFFGFLVKQSTTSFFQRHFFDDIEVKAYTSDVTPPAVQTITATAINTVEVLFSEPVETTSAQAVMNYVANNTLGSPVSATRDAANAALVRLVFAKNFTNGVINILNINGVKDVMGNVISNGSGTFSFFTPQRFDVVIDEIMADPTPLVQLPDAEYIELRNTSNQSINLQGWRIGAGTSLSGPMPNYILPADSMVVVTGTTAAPLFARYGRVISVTSFPSLANAGATLSLLSKENLNIHTVAYDISWYQNAVKSEGGWSLEMIDTKNPCSGASNWKASTDARGGTPATRNAVDNPNKDLMAPALLRAFATDPLNVVLTFDEPLDSTKAAVAANFSISDGITVVGSSVVAPLFNQVMLTLATPLAVGKIYLATISNVTDCAGNVVLAKRTAQLGLASAIDSLGIVINEILFDPAPAAVDYVEVYNRSSKIYDLKEMYLTNRSTTTGLLGTPRQASSSSVLIFPGDHYVLSENDAIVRQVYTAKNPDYFLNIGSMPSYPDDKGTVVLLNAQGKIIDELRYDVKWHFALLDNEEGISLERIDYNKHTQDKNNWHSAASTAGFGTPSYQNSQFRADMQAQGAVTVLPKVFSPDNDGLDDFATIGYQMEELGYVANIIIFDAAGRPVKNLAKNATLALTGSFRWDGLDDKMSKLPIGTYVVYTEVFNLAGKKKSFKTVVVLARRF